MRQGWTYAIVAGRSIALIGTAGCGNPLGRLLDSGGTESTATEAAVTESAEQAAVAETNTPAEPAEADTVSDPLYQALSEWQFILTSGAGGWDTSFTVNPDGSFKGSIMTLIWV